MTRLINTGRRRTDSDTAARSVETAVGTNGGLAKDAAFDWDGFNNLLRIRQTIASTWTGPIPPAQKYVDLTWYDRALADLGT